MANSLDADRVLRRLGIDQVRARVGRWVHYEIQCLSVCERVLSRSEAVGSREPCAG